MTPNAITSLDYSYDSPHGSMWLLVISENNSFTIKRQIFAPSPTENVSKVRGTDLKNNEYGRAKKSEKKLNDVIEPLN